MVSIVPHTKLMVEAGIQVEVQQSPIMCGAANAADEMRDGPFAQIRMIEPCANTKQVLESFNLLFSGCQM
jgi:hypothetical protein